MEEFSDIGKYLRLPRKQIKYQELNNKSHPAVIEAIAEKIKKNQRNFLPIIVEEKNEDEYYVLLNEHILEAAEKANLDFVWCILADEERRKQIQIEAKQRFEINILTAKEETIAGMLEYIKNTHSGWNKNFDPKKAAKAIVKNRSEQWKKCKPFKPITRLKCGIGDTKLPTLKNYFCYKN